MKHFLKSVMLPKHFHYATNDIILMKQPKPVNQNWSNRPSQNIWCLVNNQFTRHCDDHHLMPDYQSAYRRYYSCETALVKLVNDLLWNLETRTSPC